MGESAYVRNPAAIPGAKKPSSINLRFDVPLLISVVCLIIIGLLMVYSASMEISLRGEKSASYMLQRQVMWALLGLGVALAISQVNYHHLIRFALPLMGITLFLLFVVLWVNDGSSPNRTLLGGSVQPSELAKIVIIIYLSVWLNSKKDQITSISFGLVPMVTILGLTAGLILLEPDISAAGTVIIIGMLLFIISGGELRQLLLVVPAALIAGGFVVLISSTGQQRLGDYFAGLRDPIDASYHVQRAMEAVARGGLFGVGLGKGLTKFTGLPVPWTDSIFAVIAEETGILGAGVVVALFVIVLWRGFSIARKAPDFFGALLASGMTTWLLVEAIINIGVMVNLVPFAGNALPFVSFGGSNLVTSLVGVGIMMSVSRQGEEESQVGRRTFSAVINLRGRNGRRSVPRHGR